MKTPLQGIIPIDKPEKMPSSGVTARVKRILGIKAGHYGTLDPMASGVLPVMTGAATRLSDYFSGEKEYVAEMLLGIKTDTGDVTGKTVCEAPVPDISGQMLLHVFSMFTGEIMQTPPAYSALSVNGKKLYKYAVKGIEVDIKPRPAVIYSITLISAEERLVRFRVRCGAGTYVRTLCEDMAAALGTVGTMSALRRTLSAGFSDAETVKLDDFMTSSEPWRYIISAETVCERFARTDLDESAVRYYVNGGEINAERVFGIKEGTLRVYGDGLFLGLGEAAVSDENGLMLRSVWLEPDSAATVREAKGKD